MIEDLKRRYAKLQGLLNTPIGQSQGGLLSNIPQGALLGSSIFSQGMQGKDPFSALLPAVAQTAQLQKYMTPTLGKTKEVYDVKLQKNVFATEKQIQSTPDRFTPKLEDQSKISRDQTKNLQGLFTNNAIKNNL